MRYLDAADILRRSLSYAEENGQDVRAHGIYTLLRLYLAHSEVITEGQLVRARDSLIEMRSWLKDVPIEIMKDYQASLLFWLWVCSIQFTDVFDRSTPSIATIC